ncbi:MAG: ABC transporter substrate-binding protein [Dehalococcoidia bacterium]
METDDRTQSHRPARLWAPSANMTRRALLRATGLGLTGAGSAFLVGCGGKDEPYQAGRSGGEEPPPEVTRIRLVKHYSICTAPQYLAREFLREEGFTDVEYVAQATLGESNERIAAGRVDMTLNFAAPVAVSLDEGKALVAIGGVHSGCFELTAADGIQLGAGLRGKRIAATQARASATDFAFFASILQFVGIDPERDVTLILVPPERIARMLPDGLCDVVLTVPPLSQQLRTLKTGNVILNSMVDKPWSDYECCLLIANPEFVEKNPVATKRALRAILRAADVCARDPERAARFLIENSFSSNYDYALDAMNSVPYGVWRDYSPEEALRFYSLRLHGTGHIKSMPDEIIKKGMDLRFFNELKKELAFAPGLAPRGGFAMNCDIPRTDVHGPEVPS